MQSLQLQDFIPWIHAYISIGIILLFVLVILVGVRGSEWTPKNLLIIITWPLDLANLLGTLIGYVINSRPGAEPENKQSGTQSNNPPLRDLND